MNKEKLIEIINDTIDKCEIQYEWMIRNAKNLFYNNNHFKIKDFKVSLNIENSANIKLVKKTTVQALQDIILTSNDVYAVLNFASAKHPGGGVLRGAVAQEEALARVSSLYPVIKQCEEFYTPTSAPYYTDKII